jgi:putative ABC transport system permease protein
VARWSWRLFRREWRQQILVLALLTLAVAATTLGAAFAYNVASGPEGRFGSADLRLAFTNSDPAATRADLAAAEEFFGTIDVIGSRFVRLPGSIENVEFRSQDPKGAYSRPMLALLGGRYPTGADEVALTDWAAQTFDLEVGDVLDIEGQGGTVVGLVENPNDLDDEFVLVSSVHAETPHEVAVLVGGRSERLERFREGMTVEGNVNRESRGDDRAPGVILTFVIATVGMILVALIAAAGFVVLAQRRLRQLGMLAALGATERHVRLVTLANGLLVGAVAAVIGPTIGVIAWVLTTSRVEAAAAHRIDGLNIPWWLIGTSMLLAVVTATGSAWWPARMLGRVPVMSALSSRPPRPRPSHRPAALGGLAIGIGIISFALSDGENLPLILVGTVTIPLGILLISPLAIRTLAVVAPRLPVAARLALRDLVRYQARSGAALAAITLGLGIAVAGVASASAAVLRSDEGNLSDRQLMIRIGSPAQAIVIPRRTQAELARIDAAVQRLAATLEEPAVINLDMVVNPEMSPEPGLGGPGDQLPVDLMRHRSDGQFDGLLMYWATPQLAAHFGWDPRLIDSHDVLTYRRGFFAFLGGKGKTTPVTNVAQILGPDYSSLPSSFIGPATARQMGWERVRAGWFIETDRPLTSDEIAAARDMAAAAGLTVEARDDNSSRLSIIRSGATVAGGLLALGILAMTVGLIRGEAAGDLRVLTATGATSRTRRAITGTTAGALALLGALLGTAGAYVGLNAGGLSGVGRVPVGNLAVLILGVPLVAALCGWILAGREPRIAVRGAIE